MAKNHSFPKYQTSHLLGKREIEVVAQALFANDGGEIDSLISSSKFPSDCDMGENEEGKGEAEKISGLLLLVVVRTPITSVKNASSLK